VIFMEEWVKTAITIVVAVVASSGFWAFLQSISDKKNAKTKMLVGLAHDRIMYLGMAAIEKGSITRDEYENLNTYLYQPYKKLGGNGVCERIIKEVDKLPLING